MPPPDRLRSRMRRQAPAICREAASFTCSRHSSRRATMTPEAYASFRSGAPSAAACPRNASVALASAAPRKRPTSKIAHAARVRWKIDTPSTWTVWRRNLTASGPAAAPNAPLPPLLRRRRRVPLIAPLRGGRRRRVPLIAPLDGGRHLLLINLHANLPW
jgi:hypothetical protein